MSTSQLFTSDVTLTTTEAANFIFKSSLAVLFDLD